MHTMGRRLVCFALCAWCLSQVVATYGSPDLAIKNKISIVDDTPVAHNSRGKLNRRWSDVAPIIQDIDAPDEDPIDADSHISHSDPAKTRLEDHLNHGTHREYTGPRLRRKRNANDASLQDTLSPEKATDKKGTLSVVVREDDVNDIPKDQLKVKITKLAVKNEGHGEDNGQGTLLPANDEVESIPVPKQEIKRVRAVGDSNEAQNEVPGKTSNTAGAGRIEDVRIFETAREFENEVVPDEKYNGGAYKTSGHNEKRSEEASNKDAGHVFKPRESESNKPAVTESERLSKKSSNVQLNEIPESPNKESLIQLSISDDQGESKNNLRKRENTAYDMRVQENLPTMINGNSADVEMPTVKRLEKRKLQKKRKKSNEDKPEVNQQENSEDEGSEQSQDDHEGPENAKEEPGHPGHHPSKGDEQAPDAEREAAGAESQRDNQSPEISHADRDTINAEKNAVQTLSENIHEDKGKPPKDDNTQIPVASEAEIKDLSSIPKVDHSLTLFTIANTEIGIEYSRIPYRERYLWDKRDAPCHSFTLKVPDETEEKSSISVCIFRPNLEFPDETKMFILNSDTQKLEHEEEKANQQRVFGYVMNTQVSSVYGRIVDKYFYGEVSIFSKSLKSTAIFVVEEIGLLNRLMRNNQKTLKHMLMVMHKGNDGEPAQTVYNAVVTKGASLIDFMMFTNPGDINRNPFIMLSTNHNSYIVPGEPLLQVDENGEIQLESGNTKITVENDGTVHMITRTKSYTFRPHGRTILTEGMQVRTLQEHEGSVAVTAFTSQSSYDCVLPTPAFQPKRKGGYVCKVCMAVDDLFSQYYIDIWATEKEAASNYLARIIDRVSWMLRAMDFDDDKKPDNIGLDYDAQSVRWTYPDNNKEDVTDQDIEVLFQSLSRYEFSDCCLGIGFTMKNFPQNAFARRPAETDKVSSPTGVCAGKTGRIPNNLIIISANNKNGNYTSITEKQLAYLTAHEIAGALGALPDGDGGEDVCDQFLDEHKNPRHYLMWPDVLRNTTLKEHSLSSCSKKYIVKTLSTCKSACFDIDRHPFCGNGIVEEGEECDCGSEYNCKLQTCCNSRVGKYPCRKSGIGCKANGAPHRLVLNSGLLLAVLLVSIFNFF